ncbi:MAG: 4Fe-4S binding protein [Desulfobulbaceae bacterium]|nr:MAG: 4Fe-4S binding protein [Desulfobulbaceae bacterium]
MKLFPSGKIRRKNGWVVARRLVQFLSLILFFFLFIKTDYTGSDRIAYAVNIYFRIDPFLALSAMLAAKAIISLMLISGVVLALCFVFGRAFCGWFCPLGGLLDFFRSFIGTRKKKIDTFFPTASRTILVFCLVCAAFSFHISGILDPFSLLVRGLAQAIYPGFNFLVNEFFGFTYGKVPGIGHDISEGIYRGLKHFILPFEQHYFELAFLSGFMLVIVIVAERVQSRFFCRNVCPLGSMLGICSQLSVAKVSGADEQCGRCVVCRKTCPMGAINPEREVDKYGCTLCMNCLRACPRQVLSVGGGRPQVQNSVSLSRRNFFTIIGAGALLYSVAGARTVSGNKNEPLIRPPGALAEKDFLARCVRCAECIKVCIGNGLQPAFMEAGIETIFTPKLAARTGYCEFNCTLCGQVCPSGALEILTLAEKHTFKIGLARINKELCLPFNEHIPCIVCEEHCPTHDKAIRFKEVQVVTKDNRQKSIKQPYVIRDLCVGCGICETKCPIQGRSAITVSSDGETRHQDQLPPISSEHGTNPYS